MTVTLTADPDQASRDLAEHGLALLAGALSPHETREVRQRLEAAIAVSEADGVPTRGYAFDSDDLNERVFHLFNLDAVFIDLIQRPLGVRFVEQILGRAFLISNFSANITAPGSRPMPLHADQGYVLPPWPDQPLACNVAWLLDDFTEENGGTRYVPGSHRLARGPAAGEAVNTVAIEAPAGSMLVMDGRLWHQTGANRSRDCRRAALFGYFVKRWLRPQINWNAALWPETIARLSPTFLDRLGYFHGNVEAQIPNGRRAVVPTVRDLGRDGDTAFALGYGAAREA